jgi:hypothetical protein
MWPVPLKAAPRDRKVDLAWHRGPSSLHSSKEDFAMSLSDLASLGSFVSGAAVLISLIFLYFQLRQMNAQVRQTEKNQQALIIQGHTDRSASMKMSVATNPSFLESYMRVSTGADDATFMDYFQINTFILAYFQDAEEAFSQYRRGLFDEQDFNGFLANTRRNLMAPPYRFGWKRFRESFTGEFVPFIDAMVTETPVVATDRGRFTAEWKAGISAELAKA